jgi:GNAT superfamily N-acetyltransferase
MRDLRIRAATIADAARLAVLVTALGYPTTAAEMEGRLAAILALPEYATFVAVRDDEIVGLAGARIGRFYEKNGAYARLLVLVVDPAERGSGVGERLVHEVERWSEGRGASEILVNSSTHRPAAHRFYERLGYRATGVRFVKALVRNLGGAR